MIFFYIYNYIIQPMTNTRDLAIYFFTRGDLWYKKDEKNFIDMSNVSGHLKSGIVPNDSIRCIAINCSDNSHPLFKNWDFVGGSKQGHSYDDNNPLNIALLMLYKKMMDLGDSSGDTDDADLVNRREHTAKLLTNLYLQVLQQLAVYKNGREYAIPSGSSDFRYSYLTQDFEMYPLVQYETKLKVFFYHDTLDWMETEPTPILPPTQYWNNEFKNNQKPEGVHAYNIELIYPISPTGDQKICKHTFEHIKKKSAKRVEEQKLSKQRDKEYEEKLAAERAAAAAAAEKEKERIAAAAAAAAEKEKERIAAAASPAAKKSLLSRIASRIKFPTIPTIPMGGKSKRARTQKRLSKSKKSIKRNAQRHRKMLRIH